MTVEIVALRGHGSDEVAVLFEIRSGETVQRESAILSAADFADLHLSKGAVSADCMDAVLSVSKRYAARKRALHMLTYGRCSERRLAQKLRAKGVDSSVARETAALLAEEGYLDGREDALREAERDVSKLWGERRIVADLRAKGYEAGAIREALVSLRENTDFSEVCARRIYKQFGGLSEDLRERQKQIASLERAGFSFSEIRRAAEKL